MSIRHKWHVTATDRGFTLRDLETNRSVTFDGIDAFADVQRLILEMESVGLSLDRRELRTIVRRYNMVRASKLADDVRPPEFGEYLLWYLPKKDREAVIGDLEEEYRDAYGLFGKKRARIWYYGQVVCSFYPFAKSGVRRLIRIGVFGWLAELFRQLIP